MNFTNLFTTGNGSVLIKLMDEAFSAKCYGSKGITELFF
jgi:hypothetical protein